MALAPRTAQNVISGREVHVIEPTASLSVAIRWMNEKRVHRLPVIKDGKLVGIISMSDLRLAVESPLHHPDEMEAHFREKTVADAMRHNVLTVEPDEPLLNVAKMLRVSGVQGLVVVAIGSKDKVVGVISRSDLLDEYIRTVEPLI